MKRFLGYVIVFCAFAVYKLRFTISISMLTPPLIIIIALAMGFIGFVLVVKADLRPSAKKNSEDELLKKLRSKGEKIILTTSNCEVRENNYYEEITDNSMNTSTVADALYDPNRNVRKEFIEQSAIIYYYNEGAKKLRLTSQTFPYTSKVLNRYLANGSVKLYVDRFNKNEYVFTID